LKAKIEETLKTQEKVTSSTLIEVADVHLLFFNKTLLKKLAKRGSAIFSEKPEQQRNAEKEIKKDILQNWENLVVPREAYIIFSNEESYQRAVNLEVTRVCCFEKSEVEWHGTPVSFSNTQEPSNIIWENKYQNKNTHFFKLATVYIILGLCLIGTMFILFVT
jgi:hypothetical protein